MEVIYGLLPGMLLLGLIGVVVFFWAVRSGQYDDMEGAANRILMDEDTIVSSTSDISDKSDSKADSKSIDNQ
ncbi:MAG: cbb3-type cytochrome oxidase assembly protein CcoS [Piscirickettsiaceae bacterium]|nr:cbb3-type cytochrome oxidase assembly protein CcoS [Piscirickettsiaceae bacterium]